AAIAQRAPFDAILCMAVLQRTPSAIIEQGITSLKRIYPFEKFDRQIAELDALLTRGGLLVIRHTQYRLQDASAAWKYAALEAALREGGAGRKFGRDSKGLPDESGPLPVIFVKTTP